jgi:hypothetical protein
MKSRQSIIISPKGFENPPSYRRGYNTWKLCQSLNCDELQAYISILKEKLKYAKNGKENLKLRESMAIASDTYTIKKRNPQSTEDYYTRLVADIKEQGSQLFTILGFSNQSDFHFELYNICDAIYNYSDVLDKCKVYDEDIYATVLISIILDYYKSKYNEEELLSIFDISHMEYLDLKIILTKWLDGNYWN